jgi:hypothetical protein
MLASFLAILLLAQSASPFTCQWTPAKEIGSVDRPISEDSGLAVSRKFPNRVYHVNDSGDSGRFFITDMSGLSSQAIHVNGYRPVDPEDLAIGPCTPRSDCVFIGDIGDNDSWRREIEVVVVEEVRDFPQRVDPKYRIRMRYPDRAHDAESLAVHPDGTIYILTKGGIPTLYRLKKDRWMNARDTLQTLELVAAIDFEKLGGPAAAIDGRLPTAMDISPDGKRVLVLTYRNVFELAIDFSRPIPPVATWQAMLHFRRVEGVEVLNQQEAIAYLPDGRSFIYDTERPAKGRARMMRCDCR